MYKTNYEAIDAMYRGLGLEDEAFSPFWGDKQFVLSAFQKYSLTYSNNEEGSKQITADYVEKLMHEFKVFSFTLPVSDEIKELCEGKDPVDTLSKAIYAEILGDKEFVLSVFQNFQERALTEAIKGNLSGKHMTYYVEKRLSEFRSAFNNNECMLPVSEEIKKLCKGQDPIEALTKAINYEKLTKRLAPVADIEQPKRKLKI